MKKTTMRIVGFLLAAAALVFVTGCPQPESAKKPEPQKPAPQFDYSTLKNTKWMVYSFMDTDHTGIGKKGYFFAFDNNAVPELRVAYDDDTTSAGDAKTRAQKVKYTITGLDKIAVPELGLSQPKPFVIDKSDHVVGHKKSLTITVGTEHIILVATTYASNFTVDNSPETVVTEFNALTGAPKWDAAAAKGTFWKITKYMNKEPGKKGSTPKEFYMVFDNGTANKVLFGSTVGSDKKKYASGDTEDWTVKAILGGMQVSITVDTDKFKLDNLPFTLTGTGTDKVITVDGGTVFTQVPSDPLSAHTDGTAAVKTALGKFADDET